MTPKDWETTSLGDICQFLSGGTPSKDNTSYWGGDFPWVTAKDLKQLIIRDAELKLTHEGVEAGTKVAPRGAVLVLVRGMALIKDLPVGYVDSEVAFNQDIKALVPRDGLSGLFLAYALLARKRQIMDLVDRAGHGTGRLDTEVLKDVSIDYPIQQAEQQRITQVLAEWDWAIHLTTELIKTKELLRRGLMQKLLTGRWRLPGFRASTWTKRRLGDLFSERREMHWNDLPLLSITSREGVVPRDSVERRDTSNEDKSLYLRICPGDIGYNTMRMWQGVSAVSDLEGIVSPAYTVCVPREGVDVHFMGYLFKFPPVVHLFKRYSQGLVDDTLSLKFDTFSKIEVSVPEKDEQSAITKVLAACDHELGLLGLKLALLKQQKQGMMQLLLTGKVRVPA